MKNDLPFVVVIHPFIGTHLGQPKIYYHTLKPGTKSEHNENEILCRY